MDLRREDEALRKKQELAKIQFVVAELDLAHTFCKIAASAADEVQGRRNMATAWEAYDTAIHFLASTTPPPEIRRIIDNKVKRLRSLLRRSSEPPGHEA